MEHPVVMPLIVVFVAVLIGALIDSWRFKVHYVVTFPMVISTVAYQSMGGGSAVLQESLVAGLVGTWMLLLCFAVGGMTTGAGKQAFARLDHPHH